MSRITILAVISSLLVLIMLPNGPEGLSGWFTVSVLIAGICNYFWEPWLVSNRIGSAKTLSMALKSLCSLVTIYAMVGTVINIYQVITLL